MITLSLTLSGSALGRSLPRLHRTSTQLSQSFGDPSCSGPILQGRPFGHATSTLHSLRRDEDIHGDFRQDSRHASQFSLGPGSPLC